MKATTTPPPKKEHATNDLNEKKEKKIVRVFKHRASDEQNAWIMYAFVRCGLDCVKTWEAESGWVLQSIANPNKSGLLAGTRDMGACQLNWQFHFDFVFDLEKSPLLRGLSATEIHSYKASYRNNRPKYAKLQKELNRLLQEKAFSKSWYSWNAQVDYCISVWTDAKKRGIMKTTFYGYNVRNSVGPTRNIGIIYE